MNTSLDFGAILGRAWHITWRHKILWIFGILAGCSRSGSSGGGGGNGGGSPNFPIDDQGAPQLPPELERFVTQDPGQYLPWIIGISCAVLLLIAIVTILGLIGTGGLIHGSAVADATGSVTFGEAWAVGVRNIVPLFLQRLLIVAPFVLFGLVMAVLGVLSGGLLMLCLLPLICLLIPVGIVVAIWQYFADYFIVLEGVGVMDSLRKSWAFLRQNWSPVLILGIITFVISLVIGLLLGLPLLLAFAPTLVLLIEAGARNANPDLGTFLPTIICCGLYVPVLWVLSGVLTTWTTTIWTLAFRRLTGAASAPVAVTE